jgi:hypothetical protein
MEKKKKKKKKKQQQQIVVNHTQGIQGHEPAVQDPGEQRDGKLRKHRARNQRLVRSNEPHHHCWD